MKTDKKKDLCLFKYKFHQKGSSPDQPLLHGVQPPYVIFFDQTIYKIYKSAGIVIQMTFSVVWPHNLLFYKPKGLVSTN